MRFTGGDPAMLNTWAIGIEPVLAKPCAVWAYAT